MKQAFTIIELVFVIVVLGILASVALPKFGATKNMADVSKARSDVAAIRSSILTERQSQLIKGTNSYIPQLSDNTTTLFTGNGTRKLLTYGIVSGTADGKWSVVTNVTTNSYNFKANGTNIQFDYNTTSGTFGCDRSNDTCKQIVD